MTTAIDYRRIPADDGDGISPLLSLLGPDAICAWLENPRDPQGIRLRDDLAAADLPALIREWPEGRLFTPQTDIRWERQPDGALWVVVIADTIAAEARDPLPLTPIRDAEEHLLLWGTRTELGWREDRIPADLNAIYPKTWGGPHAAIVAREYEAPGAPDAELDVRRVTRYLAYDGNHRPAEAGPLPVIEE
jgi:hypothetical protein